MNYVNRRSLGLLSVLLLGTLLLLAPTSALAAFPDGYTGPLINDNSRKCLDVFDGSTRNGATVSQWSCNGQSNQIWVFKRVPFVTYDVYEIVNARSGKCLDDYRGSKRNGAAVVQWPCSQAFLDQAEDWLLITGPIPHYGTVYGFMNVQGASAGGHHVLDVVHGSDSNGARVDLWSLHDGLNQFWSRPAPVTVV